MGRMVKRLSGLEIDEISLVDRPANQHGRVVISKNDQEEDMPDLFDADENPVDESELRVGDFVYDEEGNEFQVRDDVDPTTELEEELEEEGDPRYYQEELESVGKGVLSAVGTSPKNIARVRLGRMQAKEAVGAGKKRLGDEKLATQMYLGRRAAGARRQVGEQTAGARRYVGQNKLAFAAGGAGAGGLGAGYAGGRVKKSAGQRFLEDISKAVSDEDRDQLISKVFDEYEDISKRNDLLEDVVVRLVDEREAEEYTEVAKGYGLGSEDELGGLLQRAANSMDPEDVRLIDRLLQGAGEMSKALYVEQGIGGYGDSDVLEQVYALAGEGIAKSDLGMSAEQAVTAIFDNNPAAYEEYLAETAPHYER